MPHALVQARKRGDREQFAAAEARRSRGPRRRRRRGTAGGAGVASDGAPINLGRLFRAMLRRWQLVLGLLAIAVGLAWHWERQQPTRYSAAAVVQLVDGHRALGGELASAGDARNAADMTVNSQLEILRSRAVAAEVVAAQPLGTRVRTGGFPISLLGDVQVSEGAQPRTLSITFTDSAWFENRRGAPVVPYGVVVNLNGLRLSVAGAPTQVRAGTVQLLPVERAIDGVIRSTSAVPRKSTTIMDVSYVADDPKVAQSTVNALVEAYQEMDRRMVQQTLRRRREFIGQQMSENDAQMAVAERALSAFRMQQQAYSSADRFAVQRGELAALEAQTEAIDAERRLAADLLGRLQSGDERARARAFQMLASSPLGATPVVAGLYGQLVRYDASRAEMTSGPRGLAASNPEVLRLDSLVSSTQGHLVDAVQSHIALLEARLSPIERRRDQALRDLRAVPAANASESKLSQDAQVLRDQAALLRTEYQHARIAEAASVGNVDIVDLAIRSAPLRVDKVILLGFAAMLALLIGGGIAFLLEALDQSIRDREHLERELDLQVLATVPRMDAGGRSGRRMRAWERNGISDAAQRRSVALATAEHVRAPSAESFRQLRTNLLFCENGRSLRSLVVTSAEPGEGKTSVAVNLAITFAQQRMRVLLIDCDLLRPRVHRVFGLPVGPGFQQVILENGAPSETLRPTSVPGLFVMTAGTPSHEPGDVTGSVRLHAMLHDLASEFDMIILDSPPVLAVADAISLGVAADAVLFVARAGRSNKRAAAEALRHLDAVNVHVVGAVMNDPDGRTTRNGTHRYYDYSYASSMLTAS